MKLPLCSPRSLALAITLCVPGFAGAAGLVAAWGDNSSSQTRLPQGVNHAKAVAAGWGHSLALKTDGTVLAWGANEFHQADVPAGLSNVVAIAGGQVHSLALKADGRVVAWGGNDSGQLSVPTDLGAVRAIAAGGAGGSHSLALKVDGTVVGWGRYQNGPVWTPPGLANVVEISSGPSYDLALKGDGTVVAWGEGDTCPGLTNVPIDLSGVIAVAAGATRAYAIKADGTVVVWGGTCGSDTNPPPTLSEIESIADGLALKSDGTLVAWGNNDFGQANVPSGLAGVMAIASGGNHRLAIVPEGPVQILQPPQTQGLPWGSKVTFSVVAVGRAPLLYQWYLDGSRLMDNERVSGAQTATLTITNSDFSDAGIYTVIVGNGLGSAMSDGAVLTVISPPWIVADPVGATLRAGSSYTFTTFARGTPPLAYQWQFNGIALPGATSADLTLANLQPANSGFYSVLVTNLYGQALSAAARLSITDVAPYIVRQPAGKLVPLGGSATLSVNAAGSLPLRYQWKYNGMDLAGATDSVLALSRMGYEQTGYYNVQVSNFLGEANSTKAFVNVVQVFVDSASAESVIPANVPLGLTNVVAVAAGDYHILALKRDGTLAAWVSSNNYYSLTNIPSGLNNVIAIAAAPTYNLALRANGTLVGWGMAGPIVSQTPTLSNLVAMAAGGGHALGLKADGTVVAWGSGGSHQTNVPSGLANVVAVAAGANHSVALKSDGSVVAWGQNLYGQTNVPAGLTNVIAISARGDHNLALRADGTVAAWGVTVGNLRDLTNIVAISAGSSQDSVLKANGSMVVYPWSGQTPSGGIPAWAGLSNVTAIANAVSSKPSFYVAVLGSGAPVLTISPANQTVSLGATVRFNARAAGVQPLSYRWQFNGVDIADATNAWLTLPKVQIQDMGAYRVVVSNPLGIVSSPPAQLSMRQLVLWTGGASSAPTNLPANLKKVVAMAAADNHMLALQADGTVAAWASLSNSAANVPAGLNNVMAVSAGPNHSLALKANGTLVAWGGNPVLTNVPASMSNVVAVSAGGSFSLALKADGTVGGWGSGYSVPEGLSNIIAVSAGRYHSLALKADGTVVAWGNNSAGQTSVPRELAQVVAISAGVSNSLALRANGSVVSWGMNPAQVPTTLSNVVAITAGTRQNLALRADGSIVAWGLSLSTVPSGLSNVIATASGGSVGYSAALLGDGAPVFTVQPASQTTALGATLRLQARAVGVQPVTYRWWANGLPLAKATNAWLVVSNVQATDLGTYQVVVANALGATVSRIATVRAPVSLPLALNATSLVWSNAGTGAPWFGQARVTHDGVGAAQSGSILDNQQSTLQTTVVGPGVLTFWWRVSSEEGFDFLKFSIGKADTAVRASISGETDWERLTFAIPAGTQILSWVYAKDATVSDGEDAGWLDEVSFTPDPPVIIVQPASLTASMGSAPRLTVTATGTPPLAYQWLKSGSNLAGATRSALELPQVGRYDSGVYAVRVSNSGGSVMSSNASVNVQVPQRLGLPAIQSDGSFVCTSMDADGGLLRESDLAGFEAQVSTNLVDWVALPEALTFTHGMLKLRDPAVAIGERRFYRIVEH